MNQGIAIGNDEFGENFNYETNSKGSEELEVKIDREINFRNLSELIETVRFQNDMSLDRENYYVLIQTPDEPLAEIPKKSKKLVVPVKTSKGVVEVSFGETSDKFSADQKVNPLVAKGLDDILEYANNLCHQQGVPIIKSIKVMSTTNGSRKAPSNHFYGLAIDISAVNGVPIIDSQYGMLLNLNELGFTELNDAIVSKDVKKRYIYQHMVFLQFGY